MAKTEKELADLKEQIGQVKSELQGLSDEELAFVNGGLSEKEWTELTKTMVSTVPTMLSLY